MPTYANMQIPFLGGGPTIAEQILQGLHEGATEKLQQQQLDLEKQRVSNETMRGNILNQLTQAQLKHETLQNAYEEETDPTKKQQLLNDLTESTMALGMKKHIAKYVGFDLDGIEKGAEQDQAQPKPKAGEPQPPSMFEKELQKTKEKLGALAPGDEGQIDDAIRRTKESFLNTGKLDTSHITSAIGAINTRRAEMERAKLENTDFKTWHDRYVQEHGGKEPDTAALEHWHSLGAHVGAEAKLEVNNKEMYDTKTNSIVQMNSGEINDANKKESGRFIAYTPLVQNTLKAQSNVNDIRDGIAMMRKAINAPDFKLSAGARALMALANKLPGSALETVRSGLAAEHLSDSDQNYVIAHATLVDRSFSLKGLQSQGGGGSDSQREAIAAMVPGFATADRAMAEKYLKTLENNIRNVEKAYPKIGSSKTSALEEAGGGVTAEDLLKKYPPAAKP